VKKLAGCLLTFKRLYEPFVLASNQLPQADDNKPPQPTVSSGGAPQSNSKLFLEVLVDFLAPACTFTPVYLGSALYAVEGQLLP
jgi:hypothetical protein